MLSLVNRVRGRMSLTVINDIKPFVMTLCAFLLCSATSGTIAAYREKPIAGFSGSNNKVEAFLPGVLPAGRTFCQRSDHYAAYPAGQTNGCQFQTPQQSQAGIKVLNWSVVWEQPCI